MTIRHKNPRECVDAKSKYNTPVDDLLVALTRTPKVGSMTGLYDMDTVAEWLEPARHVQASLLTHKHTYRSNIRALAAIMPGRTLYDTAVRIHGVLQNPDLSVNDVQDILRGTKSELPFKTIQAVGDLLVQGEAYQQIGRLLGVDRETVSRIDKALGITTARTCKLINAALIDLDEGRLSVRKFMAKYALTNHEARTVIAMAKSVRAELDN